YLPIEQQRIRSFALDAFDISEIKKALYQSAIIQIKNISNIVDLTTINREQFLFGIQTNNLNTYQKRYVESLKTILDMIKNNIRLSLTQQRHHQD
ncbi:MAG: hypothetical protein ABJH08_06690, partial [Balneola sp.]